MELLSLSIFKDNGCNHKMQLEKTKAKIKEILKFKVLI